LTVAPDARGGILAGWVTSDGKNSWVGVQRVTSRGKPGWGDQGIVIDISKVPKKDLRIVSDHSGGMVAVWREDENPGGRILLQHIYEGGGRLWPETGLVIASGVLLGDTALDVDEKGNIAVVWQDHSAVRWQMIDSKGNTGFAKEGQAVSAPGESPQSGPAVVSDRRQGFVVAWREGTDDNKSITAQYFDQNRKPVWDPHGMVVTKRGSAQQIHRLVWRDNNTLLVIWREPHSMGEDWEAQLLDASGRRHWGEDGIYLSEENSGQTNGYFSADPEGYLTGCWVDVRTEPALVYLQQWDSRGLPVIDNGVPVSPSHIGEQRDPVVVTVGRDAIVLWRDSYNHPWDLYGQRVKNKSLDWGTGVRLSPVGETIGSFQGVDDGAGGLIVIWPELMPPSVWEMNILRIDSSGHSVW